MTICMAEVQVKNIYIILKKGGRNKMRNRGKKEKIDYKPGINPGTFRVRSEYSAI